MTGFDLAILGADEPASLQRVALAMMLSFGLSHTVAAVYVWTFRGMSYSIGLVHAIAVGGVLACMLMLAIGNSLAAGIGIAGGLALIRFRTALRDPRDIMFVFAGLGAGIAAGLGAYIAAVAGVAMFCLSIAVLTLGEFGSQRRVDGLLRFRLPTAADETAVSGLLRRYTRHFALVTLREAAQGAAMEHAYQVRLGDDRQRAELVRALEAVPGIADVSLLLQEPTVEL
jgi:hypothetical protein